MYAPLWLAVASMPPHASKSLLATGVRDEIFQSVGGRNSRLVHRLLSPIESLRDVIGDGSPKTKEKSVTPTSDSLISFIGDLAQVIGDSTGLKQQNLRAFSQTDSFCYLRIAALENVFKLSLSPETPVLTVLPYEFVDKTSQILEGDGAETVKFSLPLLQKLQQNLPLIEFIGTPEEIIESSGDSLDPEKVVVDESMLHCYYVMTTGLSSTEYFDFLHTRLMNDAFLGYKRSKVDLLDSSTRSPFRKFSTENRSALAKQQAAVTVVKQGFSEEFAVLLQSLFRHDPDLFAFVHQVSLDHVHSSGVPATAASKKPVDPMLAYIAVSILETFPVLALEKSALESALLSRVSIPAVLRSERPPSPIDQWCQAAISVGCRLWDIDSSSTVPDVVKSNSGNDVSSDVNVLSNNNTDKEDDQLLTGREHLPVKSQRRPDEAAERKYNSPERAVLTVVDCSECNDPHKPHADPAETRSALKIEIEELRRQKQELEKESLLAHGPVLSESQPPATPPNSEPVEETPNAHQQVPETPPRTSRAAHHDSTINSPVSPVRKLDDTDPQKWVDDDAKTAQQTQTFCGRLKSLPKSSAHSIHPSGGLAAGNTTGDRSNDHFPTKTFFGKMKTKTVTDSPAQQLPDEQNKASATVVSSVRRGDVSAHSRRYPMEFAVQGQLAKPLAQESPGAEQQKKINQQDNPLTPLPFQRRPWDPQSPSQVKQNSDLPTQESTTKSAVESSVFRAELRLPLHEISQKTQVVTTEYHTRTFPSPVKSPEKVWGREEIYQRELKAAEADLLCEISKRRVDDRTTSF